MLGAPSQAIGFNWESAAGTWLKVELNQHPYARAVMQKLPEFEALTGIKVDYSITPEEYYFDKLNTFLANSNGTPDVFMTGAYQIWDYAPRDYVLALDPLIDDPKFTHPNFNVDDFYSGILNGLRWDLEPGHRTGTGPLWALPMGFEQYVLAYNQAIFERYDLSPPTTMQELLVLAEQLQQFDGPDTYALALRGTRNWATIHPGYMTTFANYGAKDFAIHKQRLVSQVNSTKAIAMTEMWVKLIKTGGSPNWSSYNWYEAAADLGTGKAAMLFDADIVAYFQNSPGNSAQAGNIAFAPAPLPAGRSERHSNLWTWALAINQRSPNQTAAWLFLQYFTGHDYQLWAALNADSVNPPRRSVFQHPDFAERIAKVTGYRTTFAQTIEGTTIQFTPHPHFFRLTTQWAATLQDIVRGEYPNARSGLDHLKQTMDETLAQAN